MKKYFMLLLLLVGSAYCSLAKETQIIEQKGEFYYEIQRRNLDETRREIAYSKYPEMEDILDILKKQKEFDKVVEPVENV